MLQLSIFDIKYNFISENLRNDYIPRWFESSDITFSTLIIKYIFLNLRNLRFLLNFMIYIIIYRHDDIFNNNNISIIYYNNSQIENKLQCIHQVV